MPIAYTPLTVANTFLDKYGEPGREIEHMKLQKLVYLSYAMWLAIKEKPLTTEPPEVWKYGPVFSDLYQTLKYFGRTPISEAQSIIPWEEPEKATDSDVIELIDWIWNRYGHLSAFVLSDMTHEEGTPWYRAAEEHKFKVPKNTPIPDNFMREEYAGVLKGRVR